MNTKIVDNAWIESDLELKPMVNFDTTHSDVSVNFAHSYAQTDEKLERLNSKFEMYIMDLHTRIDLVLDEIDEIKMTLKLVGHALEAIGIDVDD